MQISDLVFVKDKIEVVALSDNELFWNIHVRKDQLRNVLLGIRVIELTSALNSTSLSCGSGCLKVGESDYQFVICG